MVYKKQRGKTRQGDTLTTVSISPMVLTIGLERAMDKIKAHVKGRHNKQELSFNNFRFSDDADILEGNEDDLEDMVQTLSNDTKCYGLRRQRRWCSATKILE